MRCGKDLRWFVTISASQTIALYRRRITNKIATKPVVAKISKRTVSTVQTMTLLIAGKLQGLVAREAKIDKGRCAERDRNPDISRCNLNGGCTAQSMNSATVKVAVKKREREGWKNTMIDLWL
jgi:hypothetical protein